MAFKSCIIWGILGSIQTYVYLFPQIENRNTGGMGELLKLTCKAKLYNFTERKLKPSKSSMASHDFKCVSLQPRPLLSSRFIYPAVTTSLLGVLMGISHLMYLNKTLFPSFHQTCSHPTSSSVLYLSKWHYFPISL